MACSQPLSFKHLVRTKQQLESADVIVFVPRCEVADVIAAFKVVKLTLHTLHTSFLWYLSKH